MELIEARALKSSFLSDMAMKNTQQVFLDDIWCVTGINNGASEDFSVDDLLDFSDKDFKDPELHEDDEKTSFSGSSQKRNSQDSTFSGMESFGSLAGELPIPVKTHGLRLGKKRNLPIFLKIFFVIFGFLWKPF